MVDGSQRKIQVPQRATTHKIRLRDTPDSVEDIRVTLMHESGKRVDVANRDISIDGKTIELSGDDMEKYHDLYSGEGEAHQYEVEINEADGVDDE